MTFGWSPLHKGHACSFNFTLLGWHFGELRGCLKMGDCSHLGPLQPSLQGKEHHSTWSIEHRAARAQTPAQSHLTSSGSSRCRLGLAHRPLDCPVSQRVLVSGAEWDDSWHHSFSAHIPRSLFSDFYLSHPPWITLTSNTHRILCTKIPRILYGLSNLMSYLTVNKAYLLTVSV